MKDTRLTSVAKKFLLAAPNKLDVLDCYVNCIYLGPHLDDWCIGPLSIHMEDRIKAFYELLDCPNTDVSTNAKKIIEKGMKIIQEQNELEDREEEEDEIQAFE